MVCKTQWEIKNFMRFELYTFSESCASPVSSAPFKICFLKQFLSPWTPVHLLEEAFESPKHKKQYDQCKGSSCRMVETDMERLQGHDKNLRQTKLFPFGLLMPEIPSSEIYALDEGFQRVEV